MGWVIGNGILYLAVGIACLVITAKHPDVDCGFGGHPPLREWLFGTGIAYTIIGLCASIVGLLLVCTVVGAIPVLLVLISANAFTFAWMIVGSVSLWRDGGDCKELNYTIWQMGMAAVIITIIIWFFSLFTAKRTSEDQ